ncbi:dihydroorotate dehydrogenase [Candidatus Beckwithbacteria bacterium]|nr:dihydroorotate dehydrogenase [Candidatus Beckwithbacteria bacterium]
MTKSKSKLAIDLIGINLDNPTILASGILGLDVATMETVVKGGAGAVTMKSLTKEARKGHNNPILVEVEHGFLNAVGYANKGLNHGLEEFSKWKSKTPLIGSIVAPTAEEFAQLAEKMNQLPIKALELALSCPHTPGYGLMAGQGTPEAAAAITKAVRKVSKFPLIIKLSPSTEGVAQSAKAAEAEGADAINMGNTHGPGMKIDINRGQPILDFRVGGMSGPAVKPLMIRCVYDIYKAVRIPIIATGGITTGEDLIEAVMAGATAVGVGTAIYYRGKSVFAKICKEASNWMGQHNINNLQAIRGRAHED